MVKPYDISHDLDWWYYNWAEHDKTLVLKPIFQRRFPRPASELWPAPGKFQKPVCWAGSRREVKLRQEHQIGLFGKLIMLLMLAVYIALQGPSCFFFSHLAHRLFLQSSLLLLKAIFFLLRGWEEDFVEPPDAPQPQQEAAQRRTIRQRSQKSKIHHFNTKFPARKVKTGSRQMRRHENS